MVNQFIVDLTIVGMLFIANNTTILTEKRQKKQGTKFKQRMSILSFFPWRHRLGRLKQYRR